MRSDAAQALSMRSTQPTAAGARSASVSLARDSNWLGPDVQQLEQEGIRAWATALHCR